MSICFLIIIILLIVDRKYIKIGTIICMFCGGPIIDFFSIFLTPLDIDSAPLPLKLIALAIGCIVLAFGMTIVIKSDAGTGPNDLVALVISDKSHFRFGIVRIATDFAFAITGFVLGGTIGIGTFICAFLVGFVADFFLPISARIVRNITENLRP